VLNAYLFEDRMQVRILTEEWMEDYNKLRPHEALNNQTPLARKMQGQNST
ncbi:integrase core domain-containing protein, partial [Taibaiella helva]